MALIKRFFIKKFKSKSHSIVVDKISLSYGNKQIFKDLSFKVNKGEILGVLGGNGVGKTSLFSAICGITTVDYGKIVIEGENCTDTPIYERTIKYGLTLCPQYGGAFSELNVYDNLKCVAELKIKELNNINNIIGEMIANFQMERFSKIKFKNLSGGEKRRCILAMSLIGTPKVILLDEPFSGLDPYSIKMLQETIVNLQTLYGLTVIVTDHQAASILKIVDRSLILFNGNIVSQGTPNEIINDEKAQVYLPHDFKLM